MYTFLPEWRETHSRLYAYNPHLKLIYIVRHPVERVISHYMHRRVRGQVKVSPENAILNDPSYINRSRYGVQLKPYLELFPRKSVLVLIFEEYVSDPSATLREMADFLQLPAAFSENSGYAVKHQSVGGWYLKYESARAIVQTGAFQTLRSRVPASIRRPVRRLLSNRLESRPELSPQLRRTIMRLVEDDVRYVESLLERRIEPWRES